MFNNIGPIGLVVLVLLALVLFGPNKLPEFGRSLGRTIREFKKGANEILDVDDKPAAEAKNDEQKPRLPE
jgi:sec-independent protein translocase protein TatA